MADELPYRVEYAKSGRARCQICNECIAKDNFRIASAVQNPYHDSMVNKWHHPECFFEDHRPKTLGDIANFDNIRWEDQEYIKKKIDLHLKHMKAHGESVEK